MKKFLPYAPASIYDGHHSDYTEDLDFWRWLAESYGSPILELGCGTGRVSTDLVKLSHRLTCLDHDLEMLRFFKDQRNNQLIDLLQADMASLPLYCSYPLIIIPCNTYTILRKEQRHSLLLHISRLLTGEGCFSFGVPDPSMLHQLPDVGEPLVEASFTHPVSGDPVQASSAWTKSGEQITLSWIYDHMHPDGTVERIKTGVLHDILSIDQHREELEQVGLEIDEMYGDYDRSPYNDQESEYLILTIKKI